ncbi:hypothetical protein ACH4ND_01455 [Streptomyces sp. NPDC017179]|uniref:hypothetical protein n=1 Tax=Streptomyces sp. NPDC017179 TaxID=3364979 RepID=UPI0037998507
MVEQRDGQRQFSVGEKAAMGFAALMLGLACLQSCGSDDGDNGSTKTTPERSASAQRVEDPHTLVVTSSQFSEWPFTVRMGVLRCRNGAEVTFEPSGGTEYAVNGTAKGAGYPSMMPIWADDEELGNGLKVDISEVLERGQRLC